MCVCLRLQSKLTQYVKVLLKCWYVCVFQTAVKGQQQSLTLYQANSFQCVFQTAVKTVPKPFCGVGVDVSDCCQNCYIMPQVFLKCVCVCVSACVHVCVSDCCQRTAVKSNLVSS